MDTQSQFIQFARKLAIFALILVILDQSIGIGARELYFSQKTGRYARLNHLLYETEAELIVMGSSHALRHYDTEILEQNLEMDVYNGGIQGQFILFQEAVLEMLVERHAPKHMVLNVAPDFFVYQPTTYERLGELKPYYYKHQETLKPFMKLKSVFEPFKMFSKLYQYNSTIAHIFRYLASPQPDVEGYVKLEGEIPPLPEGTRIYPQEHMDMDSVAIAAFDQFIKTAKEHDINLILVASPVVTGEDVDALKAYQLLKQQAIFHGIPLLDYSKDPSYTHQYHLFHDGNHLNTEGAKLFSVQVAEGIKPFLQN
ncbi:MAG: hypothetical protein AAFW00_05045 [Bacteroidota bacterium]